VDVWNIVALASAVVSVATGAGYGLQRGRVVSLREDLSDAREKIAEQRDEIDDLKEDRATDRATIKKQAGDISVLQRVVTGEVHWQAISEMLDHHHETAEKHWNNTEDSIREILHELRRTA
jgi:predicted  nucleic acid-binding Zn-ribbon protein